MTATVELARAVSSANDRYSAPLLGLPLTVPRVEKRLGNGRFGRRPLAGRSCVVRGRRSKASQGGNRGQEGRGLVGRDLWRF